VRGAEGLRCGCCWLGLQLPGGLLGAIQLPGAARPLAALLGCCGAENTLWGFLWIFMDFFFF